MLDGSFSRSLFNIVASVRDELNLTGSLQKAFCVRHVTELQTVCNPKKRASFVERIVKESEPCEPSRVKKDDVEGVSRLESLQTLRGLCPPSPPSL